MSGSTDHPVVLALFGTPELRVPTMLALTSEHGFGTVVTANETEFWSRISRRQPDVVLLEHSHHELCRRLKARPDVGHIPVVLIDDGLTRPESITMQCLHAMKIGASAVCCQPDDPQTLARMLTAAMQSKGEVALVGR